jgi:hypothetical protein
MVIVVIVVFSAPLKTSAMDKLVIVVIDPKFMLIKGLSRKIPSGSKSIEGDSTDNSTVVNLFPLKT